MADMPTAPAWTLIDVEKVGMLLLSDLRCRFQVVELFLGRFLARKEEFATPGAVRSAVAPQRPPLRQTLYVPFSHLGMLFIADAAPRDLQRSRDALAVAKAPLHIGFRESVTTEESSRSTV
jgi:hypothetical protein